MEQISGYFKSNKNQSKEEENSFELQATNQPVTLPVDLWKTILHLLDDASLYTCRQVCFNLKMLIETDKTLLGRIKFAQSCFPTFKKSTIRKLRAKNIQKSLLFNRDKLINSGRGFRMSTIHQPRLILNAFDIFPRTVFVQNMDKRGFGKDVEKFIRLYDGEYDFRTFVDFKDFGIEPLYFELFRPNLRFQQKFRSFRSRRFEFRAILELKSDADSDSFDVVQDEVHKLLPPDVSWSVIKVDVDNCPSLINGVRISLIFKNEYLDLSDLEVQIIDSNKFASQTAAEKLWTRCFTINC